MKLSGSFVTVLALTLTAYAVPVDTSPEQCEAYEARKSSYMGTFSEACNVLADACLDRVNNAGVTDLWNDRACLAAATCQGTETTVGLAGCANRSIADLGHEGLPSVSPNNWVQWLATTCSTAPPRCEFDQQQFVDFFYGTLSEVGSTTWPGDANEVVERYFNPIVATAPFPDSGRVPSSTFSSWLRNSHSQ
ncbi:hypothetical protein AAF712_006386 [Marasmius tenuissimus]|uniref:Uncharacterized protein n=1 Tax=Marasmius tenuissimus TaxID=585030 RepID=A0ABR2ZYY2_9AGAR|nr:hypothetical protein PM082_003487 [Marasmius tenuissimus]